MHAVALALQASMKDHAIVSTLLRAFESADATLSTSGGAAFLPLAVGGMGGGGMGGGGMGGGGMSGRHRRASGGGDSHECAGGGCAGGGGGCTMCAAGRSATHQRLVARLHRQTLHAQLEAACAQLRSYLDVHAVILAELVRQPAQGTDDGASAASRVTEPLSRLIRWQHSLLQDPLIARAQARLAEQKPPKLANKPQSPAH